MAHAAFAALARASHCVTGEGRHFASGSSPRVACARPHPLSTSKSGAGRGELAVAAAAPLPAALSVRLDLARSLGRLDLSDSGLEELPEEVLELTSLEELSLSGNRLEEVRGVAACASCNQHSDCMSRNAACTHPAPCSFPTASVASPPSASWAWPGTACGASPTASELCATSRACGSMAIASRCCQRPSGPSRHCKRSTCQGISSSR